MRNPVITLANDIHRDNPVGSLSFEKDYRLFGHQFLGHQSSKAAKIHSRVAENTLELQKPTVMIISKPIATKFHFSHQIGCVSGSLSLGKTEINGIVTIHNRYQQA